MPASVSGRPDAELLAAARAGSPTAVGRLISRVENGGEGARRVAATIRGSTGAAHTVGITGPPGAGKSTLTSLLIAALRGGGERVAVLAIDPTSPFSGGAILGDRVRMLDHTLDPDVFIRSMATRGHLGGLALAAPEAVRLLDACGFGWVLVETVGVGQVELGVAAMADTTLVVLNPGWGDDVQAAKAGILEVADAFVINKADQAGLRQTRADLSELVSLRPEQDDPAPPIVETVATEGRGVEDLLAACRDHRDWLRDSGRLRSRREERLWRELHEVVAIRLRLRADAAIGDGQRATELRASLAAGEIDPWAASDLLLAHIG